MPLKLLSMTFDPKLATLRAAYEVECSLDEKTSLTQTAVFTQSLQSGAVVAQMSIEDMNDQPNFDAARSKLADWLDALAQELRKPNEGPASLPLLGWKR